MSACSSVLRAVAALSCLMLFPASAIASTGTHDLTLHWAGFVCIALFVAAYALVITEEWLGLRKSVPVLMAAGFIWTVIGLAYAQLGETDLVAETVRHSLLEYAELFLFLLVAMTYINTLEERNVFDALHSWLVSRGFSLRSIFWLTGLLAFFISPLADNMTTALVMSSVALAVGQGQPRFIVVACISIVVAANAGGAWSPFGDITTLMVWQKGILTAQQFLALFLPALVNWLVPAALMSMAVPDAQPGGLQATGKMKRGGVLVIVMFIVTVAITVTLHSWLHLPPVLGMMGGLGLLKLYGYYLGRQSERINEFVEHGGMMDVMEASESHAPGAAPHVPSAQAGASFNIFEQVARAEWDTLLFFYGIILCVGGLGTLGYLAAGSTLMYGTLGASGANILVGLFSAIIDNIPVMYAVLTMNPAMDDGQWLLVTLTAGVGGSLLSIGSAAGVAVMGQAHGVYTFMAHLRWFWAIALGYAASIAVHFWINAAAFTGAAQ